MGLVEGKLSLEDLEYARIIGKHNKWYKRYKLLEEHESF
jgi:hypothetical protein